LIGAETGHQNHCHSAQPMSQMGQCTLILPFGRTAQEQD
jgi:hypothetical protein